MAAARADCPAEVVLVYLGQNIKRLTMRYGLTELRPPLWFPLGKMNPPTGLGRALSDDVGIVDELPPELFAAGRVASSCFATVTVSMVVVCLMAADRAVAPLFRAVGTAG